MRPATFCPRCLKSPGPARNAPHPICPSLSDCAAWCPPSSSSDGWAGLGCLPGAPHGRSPWKYPLRPGTQSRTESCGGHVSDCWRQLLSACQPRRKASWTRTRQAGCPDQEPLEETHWILASRSQENYPTDLCNCLESIGSSVELWIQLQSKYWNHLPFFWLLP